MDRKFAKNRQTVYKDLIISTIVDKTAFEIGHANVYKDLIISTIVDYTKLLCVPNWSIRT